MNKTLSQKDKGIVLDNMVDIASPLTDTREKLYKSYDFRRQDICTKKTFYNINSFFSQALIRNDSVKEYLHLAFLGNLTMEEYIRCLEANTELFIFSVGKFLLVGSSGCTGTENTLKEDAPVISEVFLQEILQKAFDGATRNKIKLRGKTTISDLVSKRKNVLYDFESYTVGTMVTYEYRINNNYYSLDFFIKKDVIDEYFKIAEEKKKPMRTKSKLKLSEITIPVTVKLGEGSLTINQIRNLKTGSVIDLDQLVGAPLDVFVQDSLLGKGEVVIADDTFSIKMIDVEKY